MHKPYIDRAIELSLEGVASGGDPFGAFIVRDGRTLALCYN